MYSVQEKMSDASLLYEHSQSCISDTLIDWSKATEKITELALLPRDIGHIASFFWSCGRVFDFNDLSKLSVKIGEQINDFFDTRKISSFMDEMQEAGYIPSQAYRLVSAIKQQTEDNIKAYSYKIDFKSDDNYSRQVGYLSSTEAFIEHLRAFVRATKKNTPLTPEYIVSSVEKTISDTQPE